MKEREKEIVHQPTIGKHSLYESTNENGLRLVDFAVGRQIVIKSTYFMHKRIHLQTWHSPDGHTFKQFVCIDGKKSHVRHITVGVPQGSLIGGQIFNIYFNGIFMLPLKGIIQCYADDAVIIYSSSNFDELICDINYDLAMISQWFHSHCLQMNVEKTCFMLFKNRRIFFGPNQAVHVGGEVVKEVRNYCYLGLQIDSDLNWHEHVRKTRMKILSIAFALRRLKNSLPPRALWAIYHSHVISRLTYVNPCWNSVAQYKMKGLKVLQNRVLKIIFGFGPRHPTEELYSVKIFPLHLINAFQLMFYAYKIINGFLKHNFSLLSIAELHGHDTRQNQNIYINTNNLNYGENNVLTKALNLYNGIDITIRNERRISVLRSLLIDFLWHRRAQYLVI
jgi:hypothetical protein